MADSTQRFSARAAAYALYRPSYPAAIAGLLARECGLTPASVVADIGSGTGLLTELFLGVGCTVIGVEPNAEMRRAGDRQLAGFPRFSSTEGRAEATGLPGRSVDFVSAGQAFHWFDPGRAHDEFARILRPLGWLVLVWNERAPADSGFQAAYDAIVKRYAPEINRIQEDKIAIVFGGRDWRLAAFPNEQRLDLAGLQGRLSSSSYAPLAGTPKHQEMLRALSAIFDQYQRDGAVTLLYQTLVYFGHLNDGQ